MSNTVTRTAPAEIWLQVSDDAADCRQPFPPVPDADITWCHESVLGCEVRYVRADLVNAPYRRPMTDAQIATMFEKVDRLGYTQRDLPAFTSGVVCAEVHHKIIKGKP